MERGGGQLAHVAAGGRPAPLRSELQHATQVLLLSIEREDSPEQPKVATFRDWLLEEARTSRP